MQPIFITGIGTGVGKTVVAAILAEALNADYWKPVQAGSENMTDSQWVNSVIRNPLVSIHPETYILRLAASPHIAARKEGVTIDLDKIISHFKEIQAGDNAQINRNNKIQNELSGIKAGEAASEPPFAGGRNLIIEGAGGLLVPLNEHQFVMDLVKKLDAKVIIVSRNYLGSINHSLLTAKICQSNNIPVAGWIFNDQYLHYEQEIADWTGIPIITSIPHLGELPKESIIEQARLIAPLIRKIPL